MRRLGKYEALEPVGRGASATVYRAVHRELKAVRALKVFDQGDPNQGRRVKEAVYQSRVGHPGVVRVLDLERDAETGLFYLVMEFAALGSLRRRLEDGPLESGLALELGAQMARALTQAHEQKVWHLDLKPDNILFFGPRRVKIADFGLARTPGEPLDPAWVVGTPNYMAPEQLDGRPSAASDLWALGAMLLEMLTGRLCFPGQSLSQVQSCLAAGPVDVAQRLALAGVSVLPRQQDLIQAMLSMDPARRPASAMETAQVLAGDGALPETEAPGPATLRISACCTRCGVRVPLGRDLCPDCAREPAPLPEPEERPREAAAPPTRVPTPERSARTRLAALAAGLLLALAVGLAFSASGPVGPGAPGLEAASPLLPDPLPPDPAGTQPAPLEEPAAIALPAAPAAPAPAPLKKAAPVQTQPNIPPAARVARPVKAAPILAKRQKPAPVNKTASRGKAGPLARVSAPKPRPAPPARVAAEAEAETPAKISAKISGKISGKMPVASAARPAPRPPAPVTAKPSAGSVKAPAQPRPAMAAPAYTEFDLKAMLARKPGHLGARRNLALLYWQQGRPVDAVSQLQIILRARPHDPEAHHALQMILAGARGK